jgi:hypothetical protein
MPIYVLGSHNHSVEIPNQTLTVSVSGSVRGVSLVIHASDDQATMQPNSHLAVLPRVNGPVSVTVVPAAGVSRFAAGTHVSLAVGHDATTDLDPVQVLFDPVDVSGDSAVELATLTPQCAGVLVSAAAGAETPMSSLASAARTSARKALDSRRRPGRGPVLVAVDASASMVPTFAGGGVAAATEVVVGVAAALGINDLSAVFIGEEPVPMKCGTTAELAAAVSAATPRWSAGARWSLLPHTSGRVVACTDFPTRIMLQRFVVMAFSDNPLLDKRCVRVPPPHPGLQTGVELLADSSALDRITSSLVQALR